MASLRQALSTIKRLPGILKTIAKKVSIVDAKNKTLEETQMFEKKDWYLMITVLVLVITTWILCVGVILWMLG